MQYTSNPHYGHHATLTDDVQNMANAREFIKDRLYFVSLSRAPVPQDRVHFFTIDQQFVYTNFYADFGPSNMSHVIRFCNFMQQKFDSPELSNKILCLFTSFEIDRRANAAFLLCAYMVLVYRKTPEEAYQSLMGLSPPFIPYRDAGYGPATYHITILDCIRGMYKAIQTGLFDVNSFDVEEYEFYEKVENGDYNWITSKFLALASPKDDPPPGVMERFQSRNGVIKSSQGKNLYSAYKKTNLIKWLLENNIKTIIRLNNKTYERQEFVDAGIEHIELYFPDGSTPPDVILKRFLEICETRTGPIAVHCKAGLGRTGSLIACYLMKHYRLTACEVISFMRVIRPGSVVGPQQNYLQAMQPKLWKMTPNTKLPIHISCWNGIPPSIQITRFGHPKYAPKLSTVPTGFTNPPPPLPEKVGIALTKASPDHILQRGFGGAAGYNAEDASLQASKREAMLVHNLYGNDAQELERELARERGGGRNLEEMVIPIQPRKHLPNAKPDQKQPQIANLFHVQPAPVAVDQQRYHLRHTTAPAPQQVNLNKPRNLGPSLASQDSSAMDIDTMNSTVQRETKKKTVSNALDYDEYE